MTNPFKDVNTFQEACDQTPSQENYGMYIGLIEEEFQELSEAIRHCDDVEQLDALVDILVVTIGAIRCAGWDGEVLGKKLCVLTLPRLIQTQERFAKGKMVKCLSQKAGRHLIW